MRKLKISFLWHLHQPPYQRGRVQEAVLPWVWLHGLKDYYDMAALAAQHPGMRLNFNFTPSLVEQVEKYTEKQWTDPFFEVIAATPETVSQADKGILLERFMALTPGMTRDLPAVAQYKESIRALGGPQNACMRFSDNEFLDLQVLFVLAWTGRSMRKQPLVRDLMKKDKGYTTEDKQALLDAGLKQLKQTFPIYKTLSDNGNIEISTSPYYHPLTPLLWSNNLAIEADPFVNLPNPGMSAPEEATQQVQLGIEKHRSVFGKKPTGMWPPEGSISEHILPVFKDSGIKWIATDEELLKRSLGGKMDQCDPCFAYEKDGVGLFFRNKDLSDRIGFLYARWPVKQAVSNLMDTLHAIYDKADEDAIVLIAMDGENAWEFYSKGGYDFLDAMYSALETSDWIEPILLTDYIQTVGPGNSLDVVATGSWIGGNFSTWIGDPTKNKAWEYLAEAYKAYIQSKIDNPELAQEAHQYLLRAEASDWFWWFGKGHSSPDESQFDLTFRENLQAIYRTLGLPVPDYLQSPVEEQEIITNVVMPTDYISPKITGKPDSFYKWTGSGIYRIEQGAIHRLHPLVKSVNFGFDKANFYFKIEPYRSGDIRLINGNSSVEIHFVSPIQKIFSLVKKDGGINVMAGREPVDDARAAYNNCLEISFPIKTIEGRSNGTGKKKVEFFLVLLKEGLERERVPWSFNLTFDFNLRDFDLENWTV